MAANNAPHILSVPPHAFAETGAWSYVTNTVLSTWIFIVIVVILSSLLYFSAGRKGGFLRTTGYLIVKYLKKFFEPLLGHHLPIEKTLWFVGGTFLYILGTNLYSLFLDWFLGFAPGFHDYLRPINSDINTTLGMAVLMILISHIVMIRFRGVFGYIGHYLFNFVGPTVTDKIINVVVGWLHVIGEVVRIMALSLRLFGNIFAGAVLLGVMLWITAKLGPQGLPIGNVLLVPFYFFEMFVGFIQAIVFTLLVSLYFQEASDTHH